MPPPPPAVAPIAAPFLPPTMRPTIAPPAAGAPIFDRVLLLRRRRGAADRRRRDSVALIVAAGRERIEPHRDVRASLDLAGARRIGHHAARREPAGNAVCPSIDDRAGSAP